MAKANKKTGKKEKEEKLFISWYESYERRRFYLSIKAKDLKNYQDNQDLRVHAHPDKGLPVKVSITY